MVKSVFRPLAYFSIVVLLLCFAGTSAMVVAGIIWSQWLLVAIMLLFALFYGYFLIKIRKIEINKFGVKYRSAVLPFCEGKLKLNDVDYFVTQTVYVRGGYYTNVILVRKTKIVMGMNARMYTNLRELMDSLPWVYRGSYTPGFLDEFRLFTINERKIKP